MHHNRQSRTPGVNPSSDDGIFASSEFKEFADEHFIVTPMVQFLSDGGVNIVGKGENAGYQHFLLFPQCFQTAFQSSFCGKGLRSLTMEA